MRRTSLITLLGAAAALAACGGGETQNMAGANDAVPIGNDLTNAETDTNVAMTNEALGAANAAAAVAAEGEAVTAAPTKAVAPPTPPPPSPPPPPRAKKDPPKTSTTTPPAKDDPHAGHDMENMQHP